MDTVNRSLAIIKPKQPFVDWANQLPDADFNVLLADLRKDCLAVLIPEYDTDNAAEGYIDELWEGIFEDELYGWCTKESWWPRERTRELFSQWFDVEFHSMVVDPCEEPIEKEE